MIDTNPAVLLVVDGSVWIVHHGTSKLYTENELILFARQQYDSQVAELNDAIDALCATGVYARHTPASLNQATRDLLQANGFTYVTSEAVLSAEEQLALIKQAQLSASALTGALPVVRMDVPLCESVGSVTTAEHPLKPADPFAKPPILMEKVTPLELLTKLRGRLNKGYMSSADGSVAFNSKPRYIEGVNGWLDSGHSWAYSSTYCDEEGPLNAGPIWAYLNVKEVQVLCNLKTDALYVRLGDQYPWVAFDQPVAIDRVALDYEIDVYL